MYAYVNYPDAKDVCRLLLKRGGIILLYVARLW